MVDAVVVCFETVVARLIAVDNCLVDVVDRLVDVVAHFVSLRRSFFPLLDLPLFIRLFVFTLETRMCSDRGVLPATGGSFVGAFPSRAFAILLSIRRVSYSLKPDE